MSVEQQTVSNSNGGSGIEMIDEDPQFEQVGGLEGITEFYESPDGFWCLRTHTCNQNGENLIRLLDQKPPEGECIAQGHAQPEKVMDMVETMFATREIHKNMKED